MATTSHTDDNTMLEPCVSCERETPHDVSVQILTESTKTENAQFSREPYRVAVCGVCGTEEKTRMNNA
jgi:hypothetical protein